jgi:hypothetical protein
MLHTVLHANEQEIRESLTLLNYATQLPKEEIFEAVSKFQTVTLEVMQNRTQSTVYRLRQTGKVYWQFEKAVGLFEDYEAFKALEGTDELLAEYPQKPCVYIVEGVNIKRLKEPRFEASYSQRRGYWRLHNIKWIDEEPKEITVKSKMKTAILFLKTYMKQ